MIKIEQIHLFIIISVFLLIFDFFGLLKDFTAFADRIILPVKKEVYVSHLTVLNFGQILGNYSQIQKKFEDNQKLGRSNEELSLKVKLLTEENTKLRSQLEAPLPSSFQFLPAQVISVSRYMEVAAGTKDNVKPEMVVIDGVSLVGKIISVAEGRSTVMLPSDPESAVPAKTTRGTKGLVVGRGGGLVILDKILQKDPLFLEDLAVTSGENGFPPNLLIGKIINITSDDVSPYKQAKLAPILDYIGEKTVFILTSS
ncbi:rod shape-determining protein MreC [Candidatus Gottesmanbacteria bacterium]|nr:rod shape-determining protein MreC [Candidatus Gottesmanbacteria bacterium]